VKSRPSMPNRGSVKAANNKESPESQTNGTSSSGLVMPIEKLRALLALLLKTISSTSRLKKFGFGTRLIDDVLVTEPLLDLPWLLKRLKCVILFCSVTRLLLLDEVHASLAVTKQSGKYWRQILRSFSNGPSRKTTWKTFEQKISLSKPFWKNWPQ